MYVRLAFAVAAHLEPEILLVDEVLAVGDAEFQAKCIGKMQEASELGRTVVFVSHNLMAVQRLCSRAFVIDRGRVVAEGTPAQAVTEYLSRTGPDQREGVAIIPEQAARLPGTEEAMLRRVTMFDTDGQPANSVRLGQQLRVALAFEVKTSMEEVVVEVGISTPDGQRVATAQNIDRPGAPLRLTEGLNEVEVEMAIALLPGEYMLDVGVGRPDGATVDHVPGAFRFTALNIPVAGQEPWPWNAIRGSVRPDSSWSEARLLSDQLLDAASQ